MRRALALALLGLGFGGALGAQATAAVGGELTGQRFGAVTVPIAVDMSGTGGAKLGSYTARLTWNPLALSFITALAGNFPPPQVNSDSVTSGILKFTSISPAGTGGLVTVAQLVFSIPDTISSPLTLSFSEMSAAGTFTNLLPTLTVTNATFCPARGFWGDIDRDGASNSRDALLILSKVVGLPVDTTIDTISTQPLIVDTTLFDSGLGDVNADAAVTSVDALIILSTAVGIPIPGQRVMILAPGGCGTGSPQTLAVFPATAQLAPGEDYRFLAQGRDSAGRTVTLSNATWRSSNLTVAGVDADGTVHPRAPGSAVITAALGPGITATATVTVAARSKWYVDAAVTGAPIQFGNQAFPFDNPLRAFQVVHEGDTIAVASGTYDFVDYGVLNVGVVIQGGTPGDTTTRPLFRDAYPGSHTALEFDGGQRALVQNIAFRNFSYAVDLEGVLSFALEDARIEGGQYTSTAINSCWSGTMDSVRIERVDFAGDSAYPYPRAISFGGCDNSVALKTLTLRDSKMRFFGDGLYLYDVDSTAVIRSQLLDNSGYGIALYQENNVVVPALWMSQSRIDRASNSGVYGYPLRRVVIDSSEILATNSDAIDLNFCDCSGPGNLEVGMHGDSITMAGNGTFYSWLNAASSDTVTVDRTVVRYPADTAFYSNGQVDAAVFTITRSQFINVGSGNVVYFSGGKFVGDSLTFTGCAVAGCDQSTAVTAYQSGTPGFSASLQHSSFTQVATPFFANGPGAVTYAHNAADSITNGMQIQADSASVTDNTFSRVSLDGMRVYLYGTPLGTSTVARDTITCSPGNTEHGMSFSGLPLLVQDNLVQGCYYGIFNQQTVNGNVISRNTIRTPVNGIYVTTNFAVTTVVDSNAVSGADTGVYRAGAGRLSMTHNNITGNVTGVFVDGGNPGIDQHDMHDNSFTGNTSYAVYSFADSVNAQSNWWGDPAGPTSGLADSAFGRVDTTLFLGAAPSNLPTPAPRFLAAAPLTATRTTVRRSAPVAAAPTQPPVRQVRAAPVRVRPALRIPPRMPAWRAAVLEESARRRAAQDAKDAALRSQRVTRP